MKKLLTCLVFLVSISSPSHSAEYIAPVTLTSCETTLWGEDYNLTIESSKYENFTKTDIVLGLKEPIEEDIGIKAPDYLRVDYVLENSSILSVKSDYSPRAPMGRKYIVEINKSTSTGTAVLDLYQEAFLFFDASIVREELELYNCSFPVRLNH